MQFKEYTCDLIEHFFLKRKTKIWWLRSDSTIARNDHRYNNVQSPARCPESNGSRNDREEKLQVHDRKARKEVKRSWEKKRSRSCVRVCARVSYRGGRGSVSRRKNLVVVFPGVVIMPALTFLAFAFAYPREATAPLTSPVFAWFMNAPAIFNSMFAIEDMP